MSYFGHSAAAVRRGTIEAGERNTIRHRPGLRAHLVGLVVAGLLPAVALGATVAWHMAQNSRNGFELRLSDTARVLGLALDREVETHTSALTTLAASPELDAGGDGDLAAFRAHADRTAEKLRAPVILIDPNLRQRLNTSLPPAPDIPLPAAEVAKAAAQVFESGQAVVSDLVVGPATPRPMAAVLAPVLRDGRVAGVLASWLDPDRLARVLETHPSSANAFATLLDSQARVVARSRGQVDLVGQTAPDWYGRTIGRWDHGVSSGATPGAEHAIIAFQRLAQAPGWGVVLAEPLAAYRASWLNPLLGLAAGAVGALLLALALALWLARRMLHPVQALVRHQHAVAAGKTTQVSPSEIPPALVAEFEALRVAGERAEAALREGEERLRLAQEAAGIGAWERDLKTGEAAWSDEVFRLYGLDPAGGVPSREAMRALVLPEDRGRLIYERARGGEVAAGSFRVEVRIRRADDGAVRWLQSIGRIVADASGRPVRVIGVNMDITERRQAEERQALLMRELDHRAKNALAVVQAALRLTPKADPDAFAKAVEGRVQALARAHSLLAEGRWTGAELRALVAGELAPFLDGGADLPDGAPLPRVELDGPAVMLAPAAAQAISMALHELATNATKHGALSAPGGRVSVSWRVDGAADLLRLRWSEAGGPRVEAPPARRGFGSRVIEATLRDQLGGRVERRWKAEGLVCEVELPLVRMLTERAGAVATEA